MFDEFINSPAPFWLVVGAIAGYLFARASQGLAALIEPERNEFREAALSDLIGKLSMSGRANVELALRGNRKIEAIKVFRADTNAGLRDAKDAIEKMMREKTAMTASDSR